MIAPHSPVEAEQHDTPPNSKSQPPKLYVDRLLENRDTHGIGELGFEACVIKVSKVMPETSRRLINVASRQEKVSVNIFPSTSTSLYFFAATSSSLAFFSESRIRSLTSRIGHDRLREIVEAIGSVINARMNRKDEDTKTMFRSSPITFKGPSTPVEVAPEVAREYIEGQHHLSKAQRFYYAQREVL